MSLWESVERCLSLSDMAKIRYVKSEVSLIVTHYHSLLLTL